MSFLQLFQPPLEIAGLDRPDKDLDHSRQLRASVVVSLSEWPIYDMDGRLIGTSKGIALDALTGSGS